MIVWLNGPFGGGKSTIARELVARWPDLLPYDPEIIGSVLQHHVLPEKPDDFQDVPLWRRLTVTAIDGLLTMYGRPVLVPMTLLHEDYAREVFDGLDALSWPVFHVALTVPADELARRIDGSDEGAPDEAVIAETRQWRHSHAGVWERALAEWIVDDAMVVPTGGRAPGDVAEQLVKAVRDDQ